MRRATIGSSDGVAELIDGAREECPLPAPTLGEHTEAVLAELGYNRDEIAELRSSSVI